VFFLDCLLFHLDLYEGLEALRAEQESRCLHYGQEAAKEWLSGYTPPEIRDKWPRQRFP